MKSKTLNSISVVATTGLLISSLGFLDTPARADDSRFQKAYIIPNDLVYRTHLTFNCVPTF